MKALLALCVVVSGCAGDLDDPLRFTDCPPGYTEQLFSQRCTSADGMGCHGDNLPDANLDLVSPGVAERVRNLTSTDMCEGRSLVDTSGGKHLMVEKIEEAPTCGSRMPFGTQALSTNEIECVRRWVEDVATEAP